MEYYLCSVSFPEAIRHAGVHLGAISGHLMMMVTINNSDNSDGNGDNNNDSDDVHGGDLMMIITMVIKVIMFILPAGSEAWS